MFISNVRLGHATNSSSSHSVIIMPRDKKPDKDENYVEGSTDQDFQWDNFTLVTIAAKMNYLSIQIYKSLSSTLGTDLAKIVAEKFAVPVDPEGDVDHQSRWGLPVDHDGHIHIQFLSELTAFIKRSDVVVLGGNDNEPEHPLLKEANAVLPMPPKKTVYNKGVIARKDGDYWILYNPEDGSKIRFTFFDLSEPPNNMRAATPELVDLKITDYCDRGCSYCYQDSSKQGQHASLNHVRDALRILREMKVFEVAIGGGEPTKHPDFIEILKSAAKFGIKPSFSTHDYSWMRNRTMVDVVKELGCGIGISVHGPRQMTDIMSLVRTTGLFYQNVVYHVIPDIVGSKLGLMFSVMDTFWNGTILLLGLKEVGRAVEYIHGKSFSGRGEWVKSFRERVSNGQALYYVSIDTALAKEYEWLLKELDVSPVLYQTEEGVRSMYIDVVRMVAGPSSYEPEKLRPIVVRYGTSEVLRSMWDKGWDTK